MSISSNSPGTSANVNAAFMSRTAATTSTVAAVTISNTTESSDKDTGALIVEGGVGIEKNLNVGGNAGVTGSVSAASASITGTATAATVTATDVNSSGTAALTTVTASTVTTTGNVIIGGDLTVQGATTTINTTTLEIEDKNIVLNNGGDNASSEGAGITIERTGTSGSIIYADASATKFKAGAAGSEVDLVGISSTQTLTNKTIVAANNTITTAASGNLAATELNNALSELQSDIDTRAVAANYTNVTNDAQLKRADGDFNSFTEKTAPIADDIVLIEDSAASYAKKKVKLTNMLGGGGGINLVTAGSGDSTTGWTTYADAAGTRPVDGTGGSPNVTWTTSSSSPLYGTNSFVFTKDAANRQGQGVAYAFTVSPAHFAKSMKIEMDYIVGSGTFAAGSSSTDSDLIVYIYDVTNSQLIEPSNFKFYTSSTTLADKFEANFQTSATGTSYRLIIHCASTSASAYTVKFDNISISPSKAVYGTVVGPVNSWTPTGGWTGSVGYDGKWRQSGEFMEANAHVVCSGAPTGTTFYVTLPNGYQIDTTKIPTGANRANLGYASARDQGGRSYSGVITYDGTNADRLYIINSSDTGGDGYFSSTVPFTFGNNDAISLNIRVPILGWSSTQRISDGYDGRQINGQFRLSSAQNVSSGVDTKLNINLVSGSTDKVSGLDSVNYRYYFRTAGTHNISFKAGLSSGTSLGAMIVFIKKNGTTNIAQARKTTAVLNEDYGSFYQGDFVAGDYIELWANVTGTSPQINDDPLYTLLSVDKDQSPQTISASEHVSASANSIAGQAITGASITTFIAGTELWDTHGAYNASTGEFTCPKAMKVRVSAGVQTIAHSVASAGYLLSVVVLKNGSIYKTMGFNRSETALTSQNREVSGTAMVDCVAGNVLKVGVYTDQGTNLSTSGTENWLEFAEEK